jgi:hypothetical protein
MINLPNITEASKSLFIAYAEDAGNWGGNPLVGGNVGDAPADKGNLTQLKKAGLVRTEIEEGNAWLFFTTLGKAYATQLGIEI